MDADAAPITVPVEQVESEMIPSALHEAGHIIAAHHYNSEFVAIAAGFSFAPPQKFFMVALYKKNRLRTEDKCVIKTAGRAADLLFGVNPDGLGYERDLDDIEELTGIRSFKPFIDAATNILVPYRPKFDAISKAFHEAIEANQVRYLKWRLGPDCYCSYVLDRDQLVQCLSQNPE